MLQIFDTPWKARNELERWLAYPWARLFFAVNGIRWGRRWRLYGAPVIQKHRRSRMCFGDGLQLRSTVRSNPLGPNHPVILATRRAGAILEVGVNFAMTGGSLCAAERIVIGDDVVVGANSILVDTDFHPMKAEGRRHVAESGETVPIRIGNDVFIGMNCLILKGVAVGDGAVIGAGSVVTRDVPPRMVAAGNPARVVGEAADC